uniref:C-type lectin domain-containing protein n=1 Tax=Glossina brevipalpis TaxID=37001 RepID=A0A1A9W340_9MUSC
MYSKSMKILLYFAAFSNSVIGPSVNRLFTAPDGLKLFIEPDQKYNWFQAWNECASRNMSLIEFSTVEKYSSIRNLLKNASYTNRNLWLGGTDLGEEGTFIWASTGKKFDYTNWHQNNPDNYLSKEHCVHIWEGTNFEWNDNDCWAKMGIICQENRCNQPG